MNQLRLFSVCVSLCSTLRFQGEKSACLAWTASRAGHPAHMATHKRGCRCRYPMRGPGLWAGRSHRCPPGALLWDSRPGPANHGASVLSTCIRLGHPGRRHRTAPWGGPSSAPESGKRSLIHEKWSPLTQNPTRLVRIHCF